MFRYREPNNSAVPLKKLQFGSLLYSDTAPRTMAGYTPCVLYFKMVLLKKCRILLDMVDLLNRKLLSPALPRSYK